MHEQQPLRGRRNFLKVAAGGAAAGIVGVHPAIGQGVASARVSAQTGAEIMTRISDYIFAGPQATLPAAVIDNARLHLLDSLAAMVSGSTLGPGQLALQYIRNQGGTAEAQVAASKVVTSAINAAFANGMMAHADESDDAHAKTLAHPGASVVPAALAMAEVVGADGPRFLRSMVVGYDIGCRMVMALDPEYSLASPVLLQGSGATPAIGGCFGAAAASAAIAGLKREQVPVALSYAAQQTSGLQFWMNVRDIEHAQKSFVFGGMPARNGITATQLVRAGFTGAPDFLGGAHNFFNAYSSKPDPQILVQNLGREYELMLTNMKKFATAFSIHAPVDALIKLMGKHGLNARNVKSIEARLPASEVAGVNDRPSPEANLQYSLAATLLDGTLSFKAAHSTERMNDPAIQELRRRITLAADPELTAAKRRWEAVVEVITQDGAKFSEAGVARGTIQHPMTRQEVEDKGRELMAPILGRDRTEKLIQKVWNIEAVKNMRELRPLFSLS